MRSAQRMKQHRPNNRCNRSRSGGCCCTAAASTTQDHTTDSAIHTTDSACCSFKRRRRRRVVNINTHRPGRGVWTTALLLIACTTTTTHRHTSIRVCNAFEVYSLHDNNNEQDAMVQFSYQQQQPTSSSSSSSSLIHQKDNSEPTKSIDEQTRPSSGGISLGSVSTFSTTTTQSQSQSQSPIISTTCPPTTCLTTSSYNLLPLLPNCNEYILCQQYKLTLTFSCDVGMIFDGRRKKCVLDNHENWGVCPCVTTMPKDAATAIDGGGTNEGGGSGGYSTADETENTPSASSSSSSSSSSGGGGGGSSSSSSAAANFAHSTPTSNMATHQSTTAVSYTQKQIKSELSTICATSIVRQQGIKLLLLPVLTTHCKDYISCTNNNNESGRGWVKRQTCGEGLKFDVTFGGCNWSDLVDCPEYYRHDDEDSAGSGSINGRQPSGSSFGISKPSSSSSSNNNQQQPSSNAQPNAQPSGYINIGSINFGNNNNNSNEEDDKDQDKDSNSDNDTTATTTISQDDTTNMQTTQQTTILSNNAAATLESIETCLSTQSYQSFPLYTTGCQYYVSCASGAPVQIQQCAENLLFDGGIMGCNWATAVDCPTVSPTVGPTERVTTGRPTQRPTREPTPRQQPPPTAPPTPTTTTTPPATKRPTPKPTTNTASAPDLFDWLQNHRRQLNQKVFKSYTKDGVQYRSYWFQYQDFYNALQIMSSSTTTTIDNNDNDEDSSGSITGLNKHVFWTGDDATQWEYGLVNIAAFLAHAMTESITNDACDEYHWEKNTDADGSCQGGSGTKCFDNHYAIANSCGQDGVNYQEFTCQEGEEHMACPVDRNMRLEATTGSVYPNAPPPMTCKPRSMGESFTGYWDVGTGAEMNVFPYENTFGRTDVEGCCFWGRGAIHSKGVCNIGKINYYLGKKASEDGRPSRYPDTDFCAYPEAICAAPESREMRWVTSMFEWTERIQSYDDKKGWNYIRKLKEFVDHGLVEFEFLEATSGILTKGCHNPPCLGSSPKKQGGWGSGDVHLAEERVKNFQTILLALEAGGEAALLRALIKYFTDQSDTMNSKILTSQTPQGQLYPSYRYQLPDFLSALTYISETGVGGKKFYIGEARIPGGVRYGIVNAVMFLSQAYKESIQYDACDENNWQLVNDRFPLSNSCGQLGMSYQDMHCREDEAYMECPVKTDMEQVALTSALWFQAPAPFKCGPQRKYQTTGFWDYDLGRENNDDAYSNARGRTDVEGCCWWGRGIIQTRGTCNYGKLNYHLGKRAADDGRPALYPAIDFCDFPQGVCSSDETYGGELQWMVGFFEWADRIQTYDVDGWSYIEKLKEFTDGGYKDFSFVDAVSGILNIGCHDPPCKGYSDAVVQPHNKRDRNDTFQRFLNQLQVARNFRPPPVPTPMPSPVPTDEPTPGVPTTETPTMLDPPTEEPTVTSRPTSLQGRPPDEAVDEMDNKLVISDTRFAELLLRSEHPSGEIWPSYLYTWTGFQTALKKMTTGVGPGEKNYFYIGDGYSSRSLEYGLVNIAAFVAQGVTQSIYYDACDENSWEQVNFRYPIANSCGQEGKSYQDDVCAADEESEVGMECEVDPKMEVQGVTHARWVGAPPPMYCGDRSVGYWDHISGLEENDPPFKNAADRSDVKGCCWWGRGVLQVRGVCSYGKLNHWLGAKAAAENRPSIYPDINFCTNPGSICSDRRAPELRWVTGMFHWAQTVQRSREYNYFPTLKDFVDGGDYTSGSFIGMVNAMLGGTTEEISRRTRVFFNAMKAFNLIKVETSSTGTPIYTFCGVDYNDVGSKCKPCESNFDCAGLELCYDYGKYCELEPVVEEAFDVDDAMTNTTVDGVEGPVSDFPLLDSNATAANADDSTTIDSESDGPVPLTALIATTTNYCGSSWGNAASECNSVCPSGQDSECPPGLFCYGDITTCSSNNDGSSIGSQMEAFVNSNSYCGIDWTNAHAKCSIKCPGGTDAECPGNQKCFGDIHC